MIWVAADCKEMNWPTFEIEKIERGEGVAAKSNTFYQEQKVGSQKPIDGLFLLVEKFYLVSKINQVFCKKSLKHHFLASIEREGLLLFLALLLLKMVPLRARLRILGAQDIAFWVAEGLKRQWLGG